VLLLDTDAFCVLGLTDLLVEAAQLLGQSFEDYRRLPALPHMLKRGRLRERWGEGACDRLRLIADAIPVVPDGDVEILNHLTAIHEIDPGEALLFAVVAHAEDSYAITGDKRAVCAVRTDAICIAALDGRLVILEAVCVALCDRLTAAFVRIRVAKLAGSHTSLAVCFSEGSGDPTEGLLSYVNHAQEAAHPLRLWQPRREDSQ
jgi:hypothetical protein